MIQNVLTNSQLFQEMSHILWNAKVQHCVPNGPPLLRCFHHALLLNYSLKSTNNNTQVLPYVTLKSLGGMKASVKETPTEHLQGWTAIPVEWLPWCVREKGRYPTSGIAACKCELPDDGGIHATETCRSKGGPQGF
jgi:hypothetical protein